MLAPGYKAAPTAPPIKTGAHGFVKSPIADALAAPHGTTTIHLHPTKGVTVTHVPGLKTLPARAGQAPPVQQLPNPAVGAPVPVHPLGAVSGVPHDARPGGVVQQQKPAAPKAKPKPTHGAGGAGTAPVDPAAADTATAKNAINAILAPIIKQITDAENARAAAGQQAIGGYTSNAEDQLKGLDFQAPFNAAAGGENAINTALLARLTGEGSSLQNDLQGKIGAIDPKLAASIGGAAGATANGAANAGLAQGDATTSELLSEGANAGAYGKKLPGITALAGAQDTSKLQGQTAADLKTQLDSITAKLPQMVQSQLASLTAGRNAQEKLRVGIALAENIDPYTGQLTQKGRDEIARIRVEQKNANTSAVRANNAQFNADRNAKLAKERIGISDKKLKIAVDKAQADLKQKGKLHGLSQNEYQTKQSQALGLARIAHAPTSDGHPPVSWQQYLNGGLKAKVPIWILIEQGRRVYSQDEIHKGLIPGG